MGFANPKVLGVGGSANAVPVYGASDFTAALTEFSDRKGAAKYTLEVNILALAGVAAVSFTGTNFRTNNTVRVGYLMQIGNGTRLYKVKFVNNDTTVILHEPILASDAFVGVVEVRFYQLKRVSLILQPDEYGGQFILHPGIDVTGVDTRSVILCEINNASYSPIQGFSDNVISNLTLSPIDAYGSCDGGIQSIENPTDGVMDWDWVNNKHWAGQLGIIQNCFINAININGTHDGGNATFPILPAGRVLARNNIIHNDTYTVCNQPDGFGAGERIDNTYGDETNTFIDFIDNELLLVNGWKTDQADYPAGGGYQLDQNATYNINGGSIKTQEDFVINPTILWPVAGVFIQSTSKVVANIGSSIEINMANTSGDNNNPTHGVSVVTEADVNITHANIESSGTDADGVHTNHANAIVNIRHSRVKGAANSLNANAGTINYDAVTTLIGTNTGGTALDT